MALLTHRIISKECLSIEPRGSQLQYIRLLEKKNVLPWDITDALHDIRRKKNFAFYEYKVEEYSAINCLKNSHKILKWYVEKYHLGPATEYVEPNTINSRFGTFVRWLFQIIN